MTQIRTTQIRTTRIGAAQRIADAAAGVDERRPEPVELAP